jgi:hypothetical protein
MGSKNVSSTQSDETLEYRTPRKHAMETRPALLVRTERVTRRDEQIMARIIPSKYVVGDFVKTGWGMAESSLCMLALGDGRLRSQASTFPTTRVTMCIHHYY